MNSTRSSDAGTPSSIVAATRFVPTTEPVVRTTTASPDPSLVELVADTLPPPPVTDQLTPAPVTALPNPSSTRTRSATDAPASTPVVSPVTFTTRTAAPELIASAPL